MLRYRNARGWKTDKKIVVIESDDWGSIRMPSLKTLNYLTSKGYDFSKNIFERFDSIATNEDLQRLFSCLESFRDINGECPKIVFNTVMSNPDFDMIRESNFEKYSYEKFTTTISKYNDSRTMMIWEEAIKNGLMFPQLHGREHVEFTDWMKDVKNNKDNQQLGFNEGLIGLPKVNKMNLGNQYQITFRHRSRAKIYENSLNEAFKLFDGQFGFNSKSFIAPCYVWDQGIEKALANNGCKFIQGGRAQKYFDKLGNPQFVKHNTGDRSVFGQVYMVRNVFFEPSTNKNIDWVSKCLKEIDISFKYKKPAILTSHRLNYISRIDRENGKFGVKILENLLTILIKKFPDVQFMTSEELGLEILKTQIK